MKVLNWQPVNLSIHIFIEKKKNKNIYWSLIFNLYSKLETQSWSLIKDKFIKSTSQFDIYILILNVIFILTRDKLEITIAQVLNSGVFD